MKSFQHLLLVAGLLSVHAAHTAELKLGLIDQHGDPVANAVVEVRDQPVRTVYGNMAMIDQIDRRFVPMVIAVHPGQWVEFPNSDNVRHHVYSFSPIRQFSTRLYANEPVDPIQFNRPGIATLGCNIHDSMVAYVYVSEWQHVAVSDEQGQLRLSGLPDAPETLHVWHPWLDAPDHRLQIDLEREHTGDQRHIITLDIVPPEQNFGFGALTGEDS
ncbi:MAG: methylamine utilization protein [Pseudomonadota bacterium]